MNQKIIDIINKYDSFAIVTHYDVDPDGVGSSNALRLALEKMGKTAYVFCDDNMPESCMFLNAKFERNTDLFDKADVAIAIDLNSYHRMKSYAELFKKKANTILIDHHLAAEEKIAKYEYVDSTRASASELAMDVIEALGVEIDRDIAISLYSGIAADTGCFRHSNTTADTHRYVARLFETGMDFHNANYHLFKEKHSGYLNLVRRTCKRIKQVNSSFVYVLINHRTYKKLGCIDTDIMHEVFSGISKDVFVKIIEKEKGLYSLSFRSVNTNVANICNKLGGGGHFAAAGAKLSGKKKDVLNRIINTTLEEMR